MEKETYIRKAWVNNARGAVRVAKDRKNIYQVISVPQSIESKIETRLNSKKDIKVLKKEQAMDVDSCFIHTKNKADLAFADAQPDVLAVVPLPKRVPLVVSGEIRGEQANFYNVNEICSTSQVLRHGGKVDVIGGPSIQPDGSGVLIIVWDFVPSSASPLNTAEFTDRPGGGITFYPNSTDAIDPHGTNCASVAAGKLAGIATGAQLALLGLGDNIINDLAVIQQVANAFGGPTIVNMSFALEWGGVSSQDKSSIFQYMDYLNSLMDSIITSNPQIVFLVAAGNESVNMCDTTEPLTFNTGSKYYDRMIAWPQFARGKEQLPFYQVGATVSRPTPPLREAAIYSNFGKCVDFYTHGGALCSWDYTTGTYRAIQGTSFSTPMVAGVMAVLFSQDLSQTRETVEARMLQFSEESVTGQPSLDTTSTFIRLPNNLDSPESSAPPLVDLPEFEDIQGNPVDVDKGTGSPFNDADGEYTYVYVWGLLIGLLLVLLLIAAVELLKPGNKKKKKMVLNKDQV